MWLFAAFIWLVMLCHFDRFRKSNSFDMNKYMGPAVALGLCYFFIYTSQLFKLDQIDFKISWMLTYCPLCAMYCLILLVCLLYQWQCWAARPEWNLERIDFYALSQNCDFYVLLVYNVMTTWERTCIHLEIYYLVFAKVFWCSCCSVITTCELRYISMQNAVLECQMKM